MKPTDRRASRWPERLRGIALSLILFALGPQVAQAQYKWVGRDGVVHYSDLPPPGGARVLAKATNATSAAAQPALPAALRQAVRSAPVVLYTTVGCSPCEQGRELLRSRGVPLREQRIETADDLKALQTLNIPSTGFPVLTVGSERTIGFEQGQWNRMLDVAQYPATSLLPRDWQPEPATRLAGLTDAPADRAAPTGAPAGSESQSTPSQSGSSRIRF